MIKKAIEDFSKKHNFFKLEFRFIDGTEFEIDSSQCNFEIDNKFIICKADNLNTVINLDNVTSFDIFTAELQVD